MSFTKSILRFAGGGSMAMSAPAAFAPRQASRPTRRSCAGERTEGLIRLQEAQSIVTHFRMDIFVWPRRTMPERIVSTAALVLDQLTKLAVLSYLGYAQEKVIIDGFFKFVHWGNTGAAWSLFNQFAGSNQLLAVFALVALLVLFFTRHHFDSHTLLGQLSLGLIFGCIAGNLVDRFTHLHVVDFIYFYIERRGGGEIGFPAFNVADSAICTGVALLFLLSWQKDQAAASPAKGSVKPG